MTMRIDAWLQAAIADAEHRGLPGLAPLLTALARATEALRSAGFNDPLSEEATSHAGQTRSADH